MIYCAVLISTALAGLVQSVTGFGAGVVMLMVFPYYLDMLHAPALSTAIVVGSAASIAWKFRKQVNLRLVIPIAAVYLCLSISSITVAKRLNLDLLSMAFGVFLILLSAYYLCFSKSIALRPSLATTIVCGAVSGLCGGLFGVGGPLLSLYFLASSEDKKSYIANIQTVFFITNTTNTITRIFHGIYTLDLLPLTLLGLVGISIGNMCGLRILDRINIDRMKTIVYIFVGISGVLNVLEYLF